MGIIFINSALGTLHVKTDLENINKITLFPPTTKKNLNQI